MTTPRPEYPRPVLRRQSWLNLNGEWDFARDPDNQGLLERWYQRGLPDDSQKIVVPYPVESEASCIHDINPPSVVWYQREFVVPDDWRDRVVLRFGAADHWACVFINGQQVGEHRGGYAPFSMDIRHALDPGNNSLVVRIEDSLSWTQPRGKQAGTTRWPIDYDSVTGIWQTVWLEPLAPVSVVGIHPRFSLATGELILTTSFSRQVEGELTIEVSRDGCLVDSQSVTTGLRAEAHTTFKIDNPVLWSPDSPELYDLQLTLRDDHLADGDVVSSYVGLREISIDNGTLLLNGEPLYIRGVLDQGYFPGGWYSPLTDEDIRKDVELTLAMGLNCARKHQKAEDPRYLYWADRLGLMVWAEMPSGKIFSTELIETLTSEWVELVKRDRGHPSIITWVPFNESWGIWHQSSRPEQRAFVDAVVHLTKALDQSRPVVGNDGWEFSSGDLWTLHLYDADRDISSRLNELKEDPSRAVTGDDSSPNVRVGALPGADISNLPILLTECGGVGYGNYSNNDFSYGEVPDSIKHLERDIRRIADMIGSAQVLQGFVCTQLTDIQQEINGLLYFDRSPKLPLATFREIFSAIGK